MTETAETDPSVPTRRQIENLQDRHREAAIQAAVEAERLARSMQNRLAYGKDITSLAAEMQLAVQRIAAIQATIAGLGVLLVLLEDGQS